MLTTTMPLVSWRSGARWRRGGAGGPLHAARASPPTSWRTLVVRQLTGIVGGLGDEPGDPRRRRSRAGCCGRSTRSSPTAPRTSRRCRSAPRSPRRSSSSLLVDASRVGAAHDARRCSRSCVASLVGAWLLIFFTMVLDRLAGVLRRELDGDLRALAGRVHAPLGLPRPARALPAAGCAAPPTVLPFRYMLGVPGRDCSSACWTGREALHDLAAQWAYVAAASAATLLVWRAGLRRFAAFGG